MDCDRYEDTIKSNTKYLIQYHDNNNPSLVISNIETKDSGYYKCDVVVTNEHVQLSIPTPWIHLNVRPKFDHLEKQVST